MIRIYCSKADATLQETETLTAGMVNTPVVQFTFSSDWNGLGKSAIVRAGTVIKEVVVSNNQIVVPSECLAKAGVNLIIGVWGGNFTTELPTVWCACGEIQDATNPYSALNHEDATASNVAQMLAAAERAENALNAINNVVDNAESIETQLQSILDIVPEHIDDNSEAWAVGKRFGANVPTDDETYHNNSKYYAQQAALEAGTAEEQSALAVSAKDDAVAAKTAAQIAQANAEAAALRDVATTVSTWLEANMTNPSDPAVDASLSVAGAAADAKRAGEGLTSLGIDQNIGYLAYAYDKKILSAVNAESTNNSSSHTDYIKVPDNAVSVTVRSRTTTSSGTTEYNISPDVLLYDENKSFIVAFGDSQTAETKTRPLSYQGTKATYIRVNQPAAASARTKYIRFNYKTSVDSEEATSLYEENCFCKKVIEKSGNDTIHVGYISGGGDVVDKEDPYAYGYVIIPVSGSGIAECETACYSDTAAIAFSEDEETWVCLAAGGGNTARHLVSAVIPSAGYIAFSFNKRDFEYTYKVEIAKDAGLDGYVVNNKAVPKNRRYSLMHYFGTQPAADGSSGSFCDVQSNYNDFINAVYEPLRTNNPKYVSRNTIGRDASGTYDIYAYTFAPRYYQQSILLVGGIHANEEDAIASLARIMQLITENPENDHDISFIRQNIKITVVPVANAWGFSQSPKNRKNANNANIQGFNAASPIAEDQAIINLLDSLKDELSFVMDWHTTTSNSYLDFYAVVHSFCQNVRTIYRVNSWLCDNYALNGRTIDDQKLCYINTASLLSAYAWSRYNIPSSTIEFTDYLWDDSKSTSAAITMGVTMFFNYLIQQINDCYRIIDDIPIEDYKPPAT